MHYELISFILIIFLYWFFNIRTPPVINIAIPPEKMSNVSIFDGNKI